MDMTNEMEPLVEFECDTTAEPDAIRSEAACVREFLRVHDHAGRWQGDSKLKRGLRECLCVLLGYGEEGAEAAAELIKWERNHEVTDGELLDVAKGQMQQVVVSRRTKHLVGRLQNAVEAELKELGCEPEDIPHTLDLQKLLKLLGREYYGRG